MEIEATRPRLAALTQLRWWAAVLIFVYHVQTVGLIGGLPGATVDQAFGVGLVGVSLFFILSGFVLAWSARPGELVRVFYLRRFARIYPLHIVTALLAAVLVTMSVPDLTMVGPGAIIANLLLVNSWTSGWWPVLNPVSWSLTCEAFFYAIFPLAVAGMRRLGARGLEGVLAGSFLTVTGLAWAADQHSLPVNLYGFPLTRLPEFLAGVAAGLLVKRGRWRGPSAPVAAALAVAGYLLAPYLPLAYTTASCTMIGFTLLIPALASAGAGPATWRTRLGERLGEWSYAFYLVHALVLRCVIGITGIHPWLGPIPGLCWLLVTFAVSLGLAWLLHRYVEVPARQFLLRRRRPDPHPRPVPADGAPTRVPAAAVPVFAAAAGSFSVFMPGTSLAHVSYLIGFAVLVALSWFMVRTIAGPTRRGYLPIVGALTVWFIGDITYDVLTALIGPLGDVSISDLLWISGYPLLAIGLIRLARLRAPGRLREGMLDAFAMATVVAWLFWQFLILPAAETETLSLPVFVGAFYSMGDVVLFAAIAILVLAPGGTRGPARYLVGALTLTLIGDVSISLLPAMFPGLTRAVQADRFDGLLLVANSLLAAAVAHRNAARIAETDAEHEQRLHPARMVFLGIALVVMPAVAGLYSFTSVVSKVSLLCSIAMLTGLILARFVLVVREQERIRAVLAHQNEHDQLTGLANRQALHTRLELALLRDAGYGPAIFYLDLNGFKQINDRHGHAAGDAVLVEFARRLRAAIRPADTAARLGGDEFVVLSGAVSDEAGAQALAERLRAVVTEPMHRDDEVFSVGVSVGMAAAGPLDRPSADTLLATADAAMYAEKMRNRVR